MALPSENRLKSEKHISLLYKKGASWKTPFFRALFLPARNHIFQSVVVISKKFDNRATERNKMRRKINGILQQKFSESKKKGISFPENSYLILPYEGAKNASNQELTQVIEKMIHSTKNWDFSRPKKKFSGKQR